MALHPAYLALGALGVLGFVLFKSRKASAFDSMLMDKVPSNNALLPSGSSPNAADYVQHLADAQAATAVVSSNVLGQHPVSQATTDAQTQAVLAADAALKAPMDTLTLQRDLNVLGASPSVKEDGIMGPKTQAAIKAFQQKMMIPASGNVDVDTVSSLRRAVAVVLGGTSSSLSTGSPTQAAAGYGYVGQQDFSIPGFGAFQLAYDAAEWGANELGMPYGHALQNWGQ